MTEAQAVSWATSHAPSATWSSATQVAVFESDGSGPFNTWQVNGSYVTGAGRQLSEPVIIIVK